MSAAVLFACQKSSYYQIPGLDIYDIERDARTFDGGFPVIAHPPCRAWGRLRQFAKPRPGEKELGLFAAVMVRRWGGVLEHPAYSSLWAAAGLPRPGQGFDSAGGWSLSVNQFWWGHRAEKETWLYIRGVRPDGIPPIPLCFDLVPTTVERMDRREREKTPLDFCRWLVDLVGRVQL